MHNQYKDSIPVVNNHIMTPSFYRSHLVRGSTHRVNAERLERGIESERDYCLWYILV